MNDSKTTETNARWAVETATYGSLNCDLLLASGWEPFAVDTKTNTLWFKRQEQVHG